MAQASVLSSQDLVGSLPSYSGPPPSPIATQSLPSFDEADESIVCIRSPKVCGGLCMSTSLDVLAPRHAFSSVLLHSPDRRPYHISCSL